MFKALMGGGRSSSDLRSSSSKSSSSSSSGRRRRTEKPRDADSSSSKSKSSRGDDRERGLGDLSAYSSSSGKKKTKRRSAASSVAGESVAESFVTAEPSFFDEDRSERTRDFDRGDRVRRDRERSPSEERERTRKSDRGDDTPQRRRTHSDAPYLPPLTTNIRTGADQFVAEINAPGFSQFPNQYDAMQSPMHDSPAAYDPHVPHQFPGQFPAYAASPYQSPNPAGEAADYYGDQGQSVQDQPGIRPKPPPLIPNSQAHLMAASPTANPPPEPSSMGQVGAAAAYFDNVEEPPATAPSSQPPKPSKPSKPSKPVAPINAGPATYGLASSMVANNDPNSPFVPVDPNSPAYVQSEVQSPVKPSHHGMGAALGGAAAGAAAGYMMGHHQHSQHSSQYTNQNYEGDSPTGPGPSMYPANPPYGGAYGAMNPYHHHPSYHASPFQSGGLAFQRPQRGPIDKFVDFWKDPEGVGQFEDYTEAIGICKYCFEPGTTSLNAPRKHHYKPRRRSADRYNASRVDKSARYSSSDDEGRRRKRSTKKSSWLPGLLTGYAAKSLFGNSDFEDSYNLQSGSPRSSYDGESALSQDRKSQTSRGVYRRSNRSRSPPRTERSYSDSKKRYESRSRSRSSSRGGHAVRDAALGAAIGSAAMAASKSHRSRSKSPKPRKSRKDSSSDSSSLLDISRPPRKKSIAEGLGSFFTASSENRKKRRAKKRRSIFSFNNSSSSSLDNDLAFGDGFAKKANRKKEKGKSKDRDVDAALLGLSAAAIALDSRSRNSRRPGEVLAGKDRSRRADYSSANDEGWEDLDSEDQSSSSVSSGLAFGGSSLFGHEDSSDSGTSKWSWRWGSKKGRKKKKEPEAYPDAGLDAQRFFPPTSDLRFDPKPTFVRPGPIPLQQPQPVMPVSQAVYTSQGEITASFTSPAGPPASAFRGYPDSPGYFERSDVSTSRPHRRTGSSPVLPSEPLVGSMVSSLKRRSTTKDNASVSFDLTEEQEDKERRHGRRRRDAESQGVQLIDREQEVEDEAERRERRKEREYERRKREDDLESYSRSSRQRSPEREERKESSLAGPAAVGAIGGVAAATLLSRTSTDDASEDSQRRHDERREKRRAERRRGSERGPDISRPSIPEVPNVVEEPVVEEREYVEKSSPRSSSRSPRSSPSGSPRVYEDYAQFFAPEQLRSSPDRGNRSRESIPLIVEVEPASETYGRDMALPPGHSFHLPWPVPRLNVIEPTPPQSLTGSVRDNASPVPAQSETHEEDIKQRERPTTGSRVSWGEHEMHEYEVPSEHESVEDDREPTRQAPVQIEEVKPKDADKTNGGIGEDIEFAATVAAATAAAGFDPALVTDDPSYHTRSSPPSKDRIVFRSPWVETETETPADRARHGFVEGEVQTPGSDGKDDYVFLDHEGEDVNDKSKSREIDPAEVEPRQGAAAEYYDPNYRPSIAQDVIKQLDSKHSSRESSRPKDVREDPQSPDDVLSMPGSFEPEELPKKSDLPSLDDSRSAFSAPVRGEKDIPEKKSRSNDFDQETTPSITSEGTEEKKKRRKRRSKRDSGVFDDSVSVTSSPARIGDEKEKPRNKDEEKEKEKEKDKSSGGFLSSIFGSRVSEPVEKSRTRSSSPDRRTSSREVQSEVGVDESRRRRKKKSSSRGSSEVGRRSEEKDREPPFLEQSPEMPMPGKIDDLEKSTDNGGASGRDAVTYAALTGAGLAGLGLLERRSRSRSASPPARTDAEAPEVFHDEDTDEGRSRRSSMIRSNESPTAVPLHFRRPPTSPGVNRSPSASASAPAPAPAPSPGSPTQPRRRPNSAEFKHSREIRPLWLVERHGGKEALPEEELPSLPSSKSTSRNPSVEDLTTLPEEKSWEAVDLSGEVTGRQLSTPADIDISASRDLPAEVAYPEMLGSQQATPTEATFERKPSPKGKPKYEFHSPSELLQDPSSYVELPPSPTIGALPSAEGSAVGVRDAGIEGLERDLGSLPALPDSRPSTPEGREIGGEEEDMMTPTQRVQEEKKGGGFGFGDVVDKAVHAAVTEPKDVNLMTEKEPVATEIPSKDEVPTMPGAMPETEPSNPSKVEDVPAIPGAMPETEPSTPRPLSPKTHDFADIVNAAVANTNKAGGEEEPDTAIPRGVEGEIIPEEKQVDVTDLAAPEPAEVPESEKVVAKEAQAQQPKEIDLTPSSSKKKKKNKKKKGQSVDLSTEPPPPEESTASVEEKTQDQPSEQVQLPAQQEYEPLPQDESTVKESIEEPIPPAEPAVTEPENTETSRELEPEPTPAAVEEEPAPETEASSKKAKKDKKKRKSKGAVEEKEEGGQPEPAVEPSEPSVEATTEPVIEPSAERSVESTAETTEPPVESTAEPSAEAFVGSTAEPVESALEPAVEKSVESTAKPSTESTEATTEPAESQAEPVAETSAGPVIEPTEPVTEEAAPAEVEAPKPESEAIEPTPEVSEPRDQDVTATSREPTDVPAGSTVEDVSTLIPPLEEFTQPVTEGEEAGGIEGGDESQVPAVEMTEQESPEKTEDISLANTPVENEQPSLDSEMSEAAENKELNIPQEQPTDPISVGEAKPEGEQEIPEESAEKPADVPAEGTVPAAEPSEPTPEVQEPASAEPFAPTDVIYAESAEPESSASKSKKKKKKNRKSVAEPVEESVDAQPQLTEPEPPVGQDISESKEPEAEVAEEAEDVKEVQGEPAEPVQETVESDKPSDSPEQAEVTGEPSSAQSKKNKKKAKKNRKSITEPEPSEDPKPGDGEVSNAEISTSGEVPTISSNQEPPSSQTISAPADKDPYAEPTSVQNYNESNLPVEKQEANDDTPHVSEQPNVEGEPEPELDTEGVTPTKKKKKDKKKKQSLSVDEPSVTAVEEPPSTEVAAESTDVPVADDPSTVLQEQSQDLPKEEPSQEPSEEQPKDITADPESQDMAVAPADLEADIPLTPAQKKKAKKDKKKKRQSASVGEAESQPTEEPSAEPDQGKSLETSGPRESETQATETLEQPEQLTETDLGASQDQIQENATVEETAIETDAPKETEVSAEESKNEVIPSVASLAEEALQPEESVQEQPQESAAVEVEPTATEEPAQDETKDVAIEESTTTPAESKEEQPKDEQTAVLETSPEQPQDNVAEETTTPQEIDAPISESTETVEPQETESTPAKSKKDKKKKKNRQSQVEETGEESSEAKEAGAESQPGVEGEKGVEEVPVVSEEAAKEVAQEPSQEPVQEPAQDASHDAVQEPIQEAPQEAAQEAVQEPVQEPAEEVPQEPVQVPVQEPSLEADPVQEAVPEPSTETSTTSKKKAKKDKKKRQSQLLAEEPSTPTTESEPATEPTTPSDDKPADTEISEAAPAVSEEPVPETSGAAPEEKPFEEKEAPVEKPEKPTPEESVPETPVEPSQEVPQEASEVPEPVAEQPEEQSAAAKKKAKKDKKKRKSVSFNIEEPPAEQSEAAETAEPAKSIEENTLQVDEPKITEDEAVSQPTEEPVTGDNTESQPTEAVTEEKIEERQPTKSKKKTKKKKGQASVDLTEEPKAAENEGSTTQAEPVPQVEESTESSTETPATDSAEPEIPQSEEKSVPEDEKSADTLTAEPEQEAIPPPAEEPETVEDKQPEAQTVEQENNTPAEQNVSEPPSTAASEGEQETGSTKKKNKKKKKRKTLELNEEQPAAAPETSEDTKPEVGGVEPATPASKEPGISESGDIAQQEEPSQPETPQTEEASQPEGPSQQETPQTEASQPDTQAEATENVDEAAPLTKAQKKKAKKEKKRQSKNLDAPEASTSENATETQPTEASIETAIAPAEDDGKDNQSHDTEQHAGNEKDLFWTDHMVSSQVEQQQASPLFDYPTQPAPNVDSDPAFVPEAVESGQPEEIVQEELSSTVNKSDVTDEVGKASEYELPAESETKAETATEPVQEREEKIKEPVKEKVKEEPLPIQEQPEETMKENEEPATVAPTPDTDIPESSTTEAAALDEEKTEPSKSSKKKNKKKKQQQETPAPEPEEASVPVIPNDSPADPEPSAEEQSTQEATFEDPAIAAQDKNEEQPILESVDETEAKESLEQAQDVPQEQPLSEDPSSRIDETGPTSLDAGKPETAEETAGEAFSDVQNVDMPTEDSVKPEEPAVSDQAENLDRSVSEVVEESIPEAETVTEKSATEPVQPSEEPVSEKAVGNDTLPQQNVHEQNEGPEEEKPAEPLSRKESKKKKKKAKKRAKEEEEDLPSEIPTEDVNAASEGAKEVTGLRDDLAGSEEAARQEGDEQEQPISRDPPAVPEVVEEVRIDSPEKEEDFVMVENSIEDVEKEENVEPVSKKKSKKEKRKSKQKSLEAEATDQPEQQSSIPELTTEESKKEEPTFPEESREQEKRLEQPEEELKEAVPQESSQREVENQGMQAQQAEDTWPSIDWEKGNIETAEQTPQSSPETKAATFEPPIPEFDQRAIPEGVTPRTGEFKEFLSEPLEKSIEDEKPQENVEGKDASADITTEPKSVDKERSMETEPAEGTRAPGFDENPEARTLSRKPSKIASIFPGLERGGFKKSVLGEQSVKDRAEEEALEQEVSRDSAAHVLEAPIATTEPERRFPKLQDPFMEQSRSIDNGQGKGQNEIPMYAPSPVHTRGRSSTIFNPPSSEMDVDLQQQEDTPSCELRRSPSIHGRHNHPPRTWSLDESGPAPRTPSPPKSLIGGPPGDHENSPPRTPLDPIAENEPEDRVEKSGKGTVAQRDGTPRLEMKPEHVLPRPETPVRKFTGNALDRQRWPTPDNEEFGKKSRVRSKGEWPSEVLQTPEQGAPILRPSSVSSTHSLQSIQSISSAQKGLRRSTRSVSGDLRAASRAQETRTRPQPPLSPLPSDLNVEHISSSSSYDPVTDKGKRPVRGMADIYEGWGETPNSPRSPSRPPSVRRRQSMQQLQELETRLDQLISENRLLVAAREEAEKKLRTTSVARRKSDQALNTRDADLRDRDAEVEQLKSSVEWLQKEVNRLTEENEALTTTNTNIVAAHATEIQSTRELSARELGDIRSQYQQLSNNMQDTVRQQIDAALAQKNAELRRLREDLEAARDKVKELQQQIAASVQDNVLVFRDEDYFDAACQKLCGHVQQWVLRFSKHSDHRRCRKLGDLQDEKIADRFDNAILDGSDTDAYLTDRVRRRDVFMSVVMTMVWEFIFTRYLFGMDREQRQKLKSLEKQLGEVGPRTSVHRWRATTLSLLSKRSTFSRQRENDTEAVALEIFDTLSRLLPPPSQVESQLLESLRKVLRVAVNLSIEMRTQLAEYIMLPPLQPEYDTNGDLARQVYFNASLMNERSGETSSNDELETQQAVVRIVLFPLVVKKGNDTGEGEDEVVVCPAQVLVAKPAKDKKVTHMLSADRMSIDGSRSVHSAAPSSTMDMSTLV